MQLCTSLAIRYLYCISSRCYVFVQEAIKDFEFEFEFEFGFRRPRLFHAPTCTASRGCLVLSIRTTQRTPELSMCIPQRCVNFA